MEALRVLVVEQNEEAALELGRLVANLGHVAIVAVGGEEALSYLRQLPFNAILAADALGDMDAIMLLDRSHAEWPRLPMIMLTTALSVERIRTAYIHGMSDVLWKPVDGGWLTIAFNRVAAQLELDRLRRTQANVASAEQIAYRFAHAINNPLSVMLGLAQLMLGNTDLPLSVHEDMQMLVAHALRLTQMVKELVQAEINRQA